MYLALRSIVRASLLVACLLTVTGCLRGPVAIPAAQRRPIDRALVDYPGGGVLEEVAHNLTAPVDCEQDAAGNLIVAESGDGGYEPRIYGIRPDGTIFSIYPAGRPIRVPFDLAKIGYRIYGPVGGIALAPEGNKIYVSHREADGSGAITAFGYDGSHSTIISAVPCQGDHGMSDIALGRGRLWFGVGSATNSGVVGVDNWAWVKKYPEFCDQSRVDLTLRGFQFKSKHPDAGLFGAPETAVTAPFRPFNVSGQTNVRHSDFPTSTIYSIDPAGGDRKIEAYGVRCPVGLTFSEAGSLYMTNQGMELRGTRPIKDDADALLRVVYGWYGWPDYSADLHPVTEPRFQLQGEMLKLLIKSGYDSIRFLIDHKESNNGEGLGEPYSGLVQATFAPLSGASRMDFVPAGQGPLKGFVGQVIVPLAGDCAPFATSGRKLNGPVGFKVVRVDSSSSRQVHDLIANAKGGPASRMDAGTGLIERPVAVKFAPDGSLYIVDFGKMDVKSDGRHKIKPMSGRIFRLRAGSATPTTSPTTAAMSAAATQPAAAP
jgi:glucose/arabinose dehydrogenase